MSISGIHRGTLRKYGGFLFKQWKERYLVLTADGVLLMCRDPATPPDQMVALHPGSCEAIVEGREIVDLPRLPSGGRRDCCFALILPLHRFLLLLAHDPEDCSQWLNMLRKVRESVSSQVLHTCRCHQAQTPLIVGREPLPDPGTEREAQTLPPVSAEEPSLPGPATRGPTMQKDQGQRPPVSMGTRGAEPVQRERRGGASPGGGEGRGLSRGSRGAGRSACLRHGASYDAPAVKAVYLLMGGAAASSAMGYLGATATANMDARTPHVPGAAAFPELGPGGAHHTCSQVDHAPHFHGFDFEAGDSDFDAFDCGGFSF